MKRIELSSNQTAALESAKEQFATWRETRPKKERIPEELWAAAVDLFHTFELTMNTIAKNLRLNHTALKNQITSIKTKDIDESDHSQLEPVDEPPAMFIELDSPQVCSDCVIEIENTAGLKMRLSFRGRADPALLEFGRHFIGGGP